MVLEFVFWDLIWNGVDTFMKKLEAESTEMDEMDNTRIFNDLALLRTLLSKSGQNERIYPRYLLLFLASRDLG